MKIFRKFGMVWRFMWGKLFACIVYDKKYIKGKYFEGKYGGMTAQGWKWVMTDCMSRFFLGINKGVPFPISPKVMVSKPENIIFHTDNLDNFQAQGNYYQTTGNAKITIGKGCYIAPNVGLITTNHDPLNLDRHLVGKDVTLGENCWVGMNSVILPGVVLGDNTIVGAGSIVTKSFVEGHCVIVGNPAKKIKDIEL